MEESDAHDCLSTWFNQRAAFCLSHRNIVELLKFFEYARFYATDTVIYLAFDEYYRAIAEIHHAHTCDKEGVTEKLKMKAFPAECFVICAKLSENSRRMYYSKTLLTRVMKFQIAMKYAPGTQRMSAR